MAVRPPWPGLHPFLAGSLALHLGLLAVWQPELRLPAPPAPTTLELSLHTPGPTPDLKPTATARPPGPSMTTPPLAQPPAGQDTATRPATTAGARPDRRAQRHTRQGPAPASHPGRLSPADGAPPRPVATIPTSMAPGSAPAPAAATGADTASLRGRVAHYLSLRLGEQFRYPPSARRRGWEGRVLLAFRIEPDGRIDGVRVLDSSGYPVLDDSAAQALRGLGQLAAVVPWLNGSALDLTLPVIYRLEQG